MSQEVSYVTHTSDTFPFNVKKVEQICRAKNEQTIHNDLMRITEWVLTAELKGNRIEPK